MSHGATQRGNVRSAFDRPAFWRQGAPAVARTLNAKAVICANLSTFSGAHSDIRHPEVLWALVSAAGLTA
jgi:hypothetical protein